MTMVLTIKFSAGMGVSYQGSIDLSALPADLYEAVQTELSEKKLLNITREKKGQITDSVIYELKYNNSGKTFIIDESQASDKLLELIDSLRPYLKIKPK